MKNSNLRIAAVRSAVTRCSAVALGATAWLAALAGCGEDPILLAELVGAGQQPSSDEPGQPSAPVGSEPPLAEPPVPGEPPPAMGEEAPSAGEPPPPSAGEAAPSEAPFNPFEAPAFEILIRYCGPCHDTEQGMGDFNYISDLDLLIESGKIIPGSKEDSMIYARMLAGTMPPAAIVNQPTPEEIGLVGSFIDSLAYFVSDSY
jgi:hypothetical protein